MATFTKVSYANSNPKGSGDNRLNSIPAKAKHLNGLIDSLETGDNTFTGANKFTNNYEAANTYDRYYLEDYFAQVVAINADLANTTEATNTPTNKNFEILGTNMTTALSTFDAAYAAMAITTAGADNDANIIVPHLDTKQSSWGVAGRWGSENQVEWSACVTTGAAITDSAIFAGLKLTGADSIGGKVITDTDSAYFLYSSEADANTIAAVTTAANLHLIVSAAGVDYVTDLGIVVAVNTTYHLKISIDSDRKVSAFVNGTQYGVAATAVAAGTTQSTTTAKSVVALADNKNLIPYIGIQEVGGSGAARSLRVHNQKISRVLFE